MNRKILSIILVVVFSIALWASVTLSNYYFTTIKIPVKIVNVPSGYLATTSDTSKIRLRLRGEGWKLAYLMMSGAMEFAVSAGQDSGRKVFDLNESLSENQWLSSEYQVFSIVPGRIQFNIEKLHKKVIKVIPDINIEFANDYGLVAPINITPDSVTVYSTKTVLTSLDSILTERIEFRNVNKGLTERIGIKEISGLSLEQNSVYVSMNVDRIVDKKFEGIRVEVRNIPKDYSISMFPDNINIILRGGINTLGKMKEPELLPYIDFEQVLHDTTGGIEPNLTVPAFTSIIDIEPNKLRYIIKKF